MLVKMRLDGTVLSSGGLKPSSEVKMHIRVYQENPEVMGVTHAHPTICTSFAIAGIGLDKAIYSEALVNLGTVPCIHYETPGTQGIPDSIAPYCKDYNAVLLGNHGALSWGKTLMEAFFRLEAMEHYAMVLMYTGKILGKANELSFDQVQELLNIRTNMGITTGGIPRCAAKASNLKDVVSEYTPFIKPGQANVGISQEQPSNASSYYASSKEGSDQSYKNDIELITQAVIKRLREVN